MKRCVGVFETVSGILMVVMVVAALAQVLFRYVLKISVPWTEELARLLFVWIVYLTLMVIEHENSQLKTTFFLDKLPGEFSLILGVIIELGSAIFLSCLFIGSLFMFKTSETLHYGTMPWLSTSVSYLPIILSVPFATFFVIKRCIKILRLFAKK